MNKANYLTKHSVNNLIELWRWYQRVKHLFPYQPTIKSRGGAGGEGGGTLIHSAYCKTDAGAGSTLVCYLDEDGTGEEITVHFSIVGGSTLNAALPFLSDGDMIFVAHIEALAAWWCVSPFIGKQQIIDLVKTMFDECA